MSIVFYNAPFSSATPVWSAMRELEVPHEQIDLQLGPAGTRSPEHLARNPNGKVPTLVVDGTPMFEALAIMQWLGDRYGVARGLWPAADAPERLTALSWTTWSYVSFVGALRLLHVTTSERSPKELHSEVHAAFAKKELEGQFAVLDGWLAERRFILGDAYSLADLIVGSVILYARMSGAPVDAYPHVKAWADQVAARPAIRAAWS